ncbi:MAG TPA: indole-3-glycerol phosphate synthase TrpC [Acidimicrobiales bacterium]|nr:indole-3-glycerol phosphate synthase TrpC [Acidimicrobiales bacterium]
MATYLDAIVAAHRGYPEPVVSDADLTAAPRVRDFAGAIGASDTLNVIAEVKRRSPSMGDLNPDLDPALMAKAYVDGGAAALSVLTDADYFGGSAADLHAARTAVEVPVLRKDFTVSDADVRAARAMGADAVLLIVAALSDDELAGLHVSAAGLGLAAVVEVHDEGELARALRAGARIVGVNQRDLRTFEVDPDRALRLAQQIPDGVVRVAESGVRGPEDAARLRSAGYDAVLVGQTVVTAGDPATMVRSLRCS